MQNPLKFRRQKTPTTAENKLNHVYGSKYRINLDHQILTGHDVFYPQALYNDLVFELTLAPASQVVRGSDTTKLRYKLTNIQLEYEMVRSQMLVDEQPTFTKAAKGLPMTTCLGIKWCRSTKEQKRE